MMLYDYCAKCGRRIEIGVGEVVYNTYYDGEAVTFCKSCVEIVDVDKECGISAMEGEQP